MFDFALLTGCKGAELVKAEGLFVTVGDVFGINVIGSTTEVKMGRSDAGGVAFTPEDNGRWKVYVPSEGTVYSLDAARFDGGQGYKKALTEVAITIA